MHPTQLFILEAGPLYDTFCNNSLGCICYDYLQEVETNMQKTNKYESMQDVNHVYCFRIAHTCVTIISNSINTGVSRFIY